MNRRSFLKLFATAGPVAAVAPTYFFAPVGGWKSDTIINPLQERLDRALLLVDEYMERVALGVTLADCGRFVHVGSGPVPRGYIPLANVIQRKDLRLHGIHRLST